MQCASSIATSDTPLATSASRGSLLPSVSGVVITSSGPPRGDLRHRRAPRLAAHRAVEAHAANAPLDEPAVLILQQRDQRRHHDHRPWQQHRRNLVAGRLAEAGGQHEQHVAAREHVGDDLLLLGMQSLDAEAQGGLRRRGRDHARLRRELDHGRPRSAHPLLHRGLVGQRSSHARRILHFARRELRPAATAATPTATRTPRARLARRLRHRARTSSPRRCPWRRMRPGTRPLRGSRGRSRTSTSRATSVP